MARFHIDVVASYAPTEPLGPDYPLLDAGPELKVPESVHDALWVWIQADSRGDTDDLQIKDVRLEDDGSAQPFRLTLIVTCEVEAPTEWDARTDARSWLLSEIAAGQLPTAESVVANAD